MKKYLSSVLKISWIQNILLKFFVWVHNFAYKAISSLVLVDNNGQHPKHAILNYEKFYRDNLIETDTVLDIGCGNGTLAAAVATKVKKVVAIEIEQKNIEEAKRKNQKDNIEYIHGDATVWNPDQKFDSILLSNVLEHIENRVEFLQKIHKLSNKILLRVPMIDRDWLPVFKRDHGFEYRLDSTHFIEFTLPELQAELNQSGWKLDSYTIQFGELWGIVTQQ